RGVGTIDIGVVVLGVVKLHNLTGNMWFQCTIVIGQFWQFVFSHVVLLKSSDDFIGPLTTVTLPVHTKLLPPGAGQGFRARSSLKRLWASLLSRNSPGTASCVLGVPSACARLSAMASRRRMRPAIASLVMGGSAMRPSVSRDACWCSTRSLPAYSMWSGTSSPKISSARVTRALAATAACAERRSLASSKFASRFDDERTSLVV